MEPDVDLLLRTLAARQHGVIARRQAHELGVSPDALLHRGRVGDWAPVGPEVLRLVGTPHTPLVGAMAAVLDGGPGAVLALGSGVAHWGVPGFALAPHHVLRTRAGRQRHRPLGVLHTTTNLPAHHVTTLEGIPITRPERTVADLAGRLHPDRLERLVDAAWTRRLVSYGSLVALVDELRPMRRRGVRVLDEILSVRPADYRPPESGLEARVQELLRKAGIGDFERQVDLGDEFWIGRVDFFSPRRQLVLEVNGDRFHTSPVDVERDRVRVDRLRAAGVGVISVPEFDIWHRPQAIIDAVRTHPAVASPSHAA